MIGKKSKSSGVTKYLQTLTSISINNSLKGQSKNNQILNKNPLFKVQEGILHS